MRVKNGQTMFNFSDDDDDDYNIDYDETSRDIGTGFENQSIAKLAKVLFESKVFIGEYKGRQFCESIANYKDVIAVDSDETELFNALAAFKKRLQNHYDDDKISTAITGPITSDKGEQYWLWTELQNVPFGTYWLAIKAIEIQDRQITLNVKCLRPYETKRTSLNDDWPEDWYASVKTSASLFMNSMNRLYDDIDWQTILNVGRFLLVFLLVGFSALFELLKFSSELALKLSNQLIRFIDVITPIVLALIDMMTKIIYGLFILFKRRDTSSYGPDLRYRSLPDKYTSSANHYYNNRARRQRF